MLTKKEAQRIDIVRSQFLRNVWGLVNANGEVSNEHSALFEEFLEYGAIENDQRLSEAALTALPLEINKFLNAQSKKFDQWDKFKKLTTRFFEDCHYVLEGDLNEKGHPQIGNGYRLLVSKTTNEDLGEGALYAGRADKLRIKYVPR